jgi:hypothetical protein
MLLFCKLVAKCSPTPFIGNLLLLKFRYFNVLFDCKPNNTFKNVTGVSEQSERESFIKDFVL